MLWLRRKFFGSSIQKPSGSERERDSNYKFFYAQASIRKRTNTVEALQDSDGQLVHDKTGMGNLVINYFNDLFSTSSCVCEPVVSLIEDKVTKDMNDHLFAPFNPDEFLKGYFSDTSRLISRA